MIKCHNIDGATLLFQKYGKIVNMEAAFETALRYHNFIFLNEKTFGNVSIGKMLMLIILSECKYYPFIIMAAKCKDIDLEMYRVFIHTFSNNELSIDYNGFGSENSAIRLEYDSFIPKGSESDQPFLKVKSENIRGEGFYKLSIPVGTKIILKSGDVKYTYGSTWEGRKVIEYYLKVPADFEFYFEFDCAGGKLLKGIYKFNGRLDVFTICEGKCEWSGEVSEFSFQIGALLNPTILEIP